MASEQKPGGDLTGRDRLLRNTIVSWISQFVVIIAGFALPRLMHENLGQTTLGIWDFAWTFANYFSLMNLGIGSSVNRFVAKYRAEGDMTSLNAAISTVTLIQFLVTGAVIALTIGISAFLEYGYKDALGDNVPTAQAIVLALGFCVALEMFANPARGVLTGYHRWDMHNALSAASSILGVTLMAIVLLAGGGIIAVSIAYFVSIVFTEGARIYLAVRVARGEIRLRPSQWSLSQAREQLIFGGKTLLLAFPHVVLIQTVNLITVTLLGPAALAVFARPFALVRHLLTLIFKFTMMLVPTAGSMGSPDTEEFRAFFVQTIRMNFAITVPAIAFFMVFGDTILLLWMGPEYQNWALVATLAAGHLLSIGQDGCIRILQGLNRHGPLSMYLSASVPVLALGTWFLLRDGEWTLVSSALTLSVPMTLAFGVLVPVFACRTLGVRAWTYISRVILVPFAINLPFVGGLLLSRLWFEQGLMLYAGATFMAVGCLELAIYFRFLIPADGRQRLLKLVRLG